MTPALQRVLERLSGAKKSGGSWAARCPAHDDRAPSLSVSQGDKGVVLYCHAGCSTDEVLHALGLKAGDLFDEERKAAREIVATYDYRDEDGVLLFQVVRFQPKDFRQRRPDKGARDGWSWKLGDTRRVLYRLPEVLAAIEAGQTVYVCEGEKDVHALERAGEVATTNPGGAGKWKADYTAALAGGSIVLVADRDEVGIIHANVIANHLEDVADVRVVLPARGKDVADHLAAGLGVDDFVPLEAEPQEPTAADLLAPMADVVPLRELIPEDGFLAEYVAYSRQAVMAPTEFHLAAGLACLSGAVGRSVVWRLGRRWHPHLWMLLMARAGGMKSTVLYVALDVIRRARGDEAILPNRFSPEAFFDALSSRPDGFWDIGEIAAFLRGAGRDYMNGIREDLCDVWDSKLIERKLKSGTTKVDDPAPTAVATGRMTDFEQASGRADFLSGFLSRFLIVRSDEEAEYRGLRSQQNGKSAALEEEADRLATILRRIGTSGQHDGPARVRFTDAAIDWWEEADQRWIMEAANAPALLQGFSKRRGIQALKLAVLHACARPPYAPNVEIDDAQFGVAVAEACYADVARTTLEDIGLEREDIRRADIFASARDLAAASGGIVKARDLIRRVSRRVRGKRELDDLFALWTGAGLIEVGLLKQGPGRPARMVRFPDLCPDAPAGWAVEP